MLQHIILILMLLIPFFSAGQKPDVSEELEAIIESIVENLEEDAEVTQITQDLEQLAENPLNINSATENDLLKLHVLNQVQIQKILDYRNKFGSVYSIFELNAIDGISRNELLKTAPFVWFGPAEEKTETFSDALKYPRQQLFARTQSLLQKQKGFREKDDGTIPYEGNRARYYTRYHFEAGEKISAGITAEKDPGEAFFNGSNNSGFDYYSGYVSLQINPVIQKVIVGDFLVRAGQGLVVWQGYSSSKSLYTLDILKTGQSIRPFTSADENRFFRGAATSIALGSGTLELFYSNKKRDANIIFSDSAATYFTSLQTSGYHRTNSETADENSVKETNAGVIFTYNFQNLNIGATFVNQQFELPYIRSDQLYNLFQFRGKQNYTGGANYLYSKGKYQLFGEAALSKSKGKAFVQGAVAHLSDQLGFSALFRHFDKNYHALWAGPFAEGSAANNETGLFLGTKILPVKYVALSAYSDFYRSEWITFSTAAPASGFDVFAQADMVFSDKFRFYLRLKNEEKEQKFKMENRYINLPETTRKTRFHIQYQLSEKIGLRTRMEHVFYKGMEKENGFMVYQDIRYSPVQFPATGYFRVAWFNTDSYNSRIYAYENDLLYTFSIPAYYGNGWRAYINLRCKISRQIDFWFKLADTIWTDRKTISSGYNEISGNQKTEVKFQLRLKI